MSVRRAAIAGLASLSLALPAAGEVRILDDGSDFDVTGTAGVGGSFTPGNPLAIVGDDDVNQDDRALVKFYISDLPDPVPTSLLEINVVESFIQQQPENVLDSTPPFMNPGLGDLLAEPVPDYVNPFPDDYATPAVGPPVVLVPAGQDAPALLVADVTDAVQAARNIADPFVAFRIETEIESNGDGHVQQWTIDLSESGPDTSPALVVSEPDAELCGSAAFVLCAVVRRRR